MTARSGLGKKLLKKDNKEVRIKHNMRCMDHVVPMVILM